MEGIVWSRKKEKETLLAKNNQLTEEINSTKSKAIDDVKKKQAELQEQLDKAGLLREEEKKLKEGLAKEKEELLTKNGQLNEKLSKMKEKATNDLINATKKQEQLQEQLERAGSSLQGEQKWKSLFDQEQKEKEELLTKNEQLNKELATTKAQAINDSTNAKKKQDEYQEQLEKSEKEILSIKKMKNCLKKKKKQPMI